MELIATGLQLDTDDAATSASVFGREGRGEDLKLLDGVNFRANQEIVVEVVVTLSLDNKQVGIAPGPVQVIAAARLTLHAGGGSRHEWNKIVEVASIERKIS